MFAKGLSLSANVSIQDAVVFRRFIVDFPSSTRSISISKRQILFGK